ncbi:MAG: hypothetical protein ACK52I_31165 [Pseudomonadota bacterium]|jgi:hypothetical protein
MTIDYISASDRLGTSLAAKRSAAIAYLRSRGKYIVDADCNWRPTSAAATDVQRTIVNAMAETITQDCVRQAMGVPSLLRRQAA